ncbi:TIGR03085 family metal-binding protein [Williamsia deligens]|uniref:TIGR03085 family metal-binding protein n=1 Tax=Williamsia deligens TaxID=321325 RepID=A0ABW3GH11_9NOCA|nr:TIGR03085 family metal-binding protein [Williamsia deligens]MCP2195456.1 TIGR03085 family protein [Williamsia deligens]
MSVVSDERAALAQTFREAGPDAPTLCGGWQTRDLLAHLVVRESRPDAAPGILVPFLAGYTERVQNSYARGDYAGLVGRFASGPPLWSPFRLVEGLANTAEFFVHHEDVRRGSTGWEPRTLPTGLHSALTSTLKRMGKPLLRSVPARLTLVDPAGGEVLTTGSGPAVTITGDIGELMLFAFGRDAVRVEFTGSDSAVESVRGASRGL